jgi:hypothetical protein
MWVKAGLLTTAQINEIYRRTKVNTTFSDTLEAGSVAPKMSDDAESDSARYVVEKTLNQGGMGRILVWWPPPLAAAITSMIATASRPNARPVWPPFSRPPHPPLDTGSPLRTHAGRDPLRSQAR